MSNDVRGGAIAAARSDYKFWIALLGALLSAPAIISLIQKLAKIGLAPTLAGILDYYRNLYYPVVGALQSLLAFIPWFDFYALIYSAFMSRDVYKDLTALSLVSAIALYRVVMRNNLSLDELVSATIVALVFFVVFAVLALTLIPLIFPLGVLLNMTRYKDNTERWEYLISLALAAVAVAVFYITNAIIKGN
jgi:hypothetical protein